MLRLLQIELQKLLLNRTSKVLIFISFILPFTVLILASLEINFFGLFTLELGELGIYNFPVIWHVTTYFASQFKFFFAIVVVSMISNEYSNKTLKQNLIDGFSKKEFILSKFYTIILFSVFATCLIGIASLCIGLYYSSFNEIGIIFTDIEYLAAYFFKLLGFFSLALFFAMVTKRSAFALAFIFLLFIAEWILYGLFAWQGGTSLANSIQGFFPLTSMANLIEQPFQRLMAGKVPTNADLSYDYALHWYEVLIVIFWIVFFTFMSYLLLKKRDL